MSRLGHADLNAVLDFAGAARSFPNLPAFREGILPGLGELVPCDLVGYNEVDTRNGRSLVLLDQPERKVDNDEEILTRLADEHPLIRRHAVGDISTAAISDFLSPSQFHRLSLYDELYKPLGAEDQIAFGIAGAGVIVGVAFNSARRNFTGRDRDVLEAIRPHMQAAYVETRARERARALVTALRDGIERAGGAVMVLDHRGRVQHAGLAARALLAAYAGPGLLPAPVERWLAGDPDEAPLALAGEAGVLTVSRFHEGDTVALLLEEQRTGPSPERLRELGLTRREAEVLSLVATGQSDREIADALVVSPATVRKHLERIYTKLGVHSRTEAAACAHGSRPPDPG